MIDTKLDIKLDVFSLYKNEKVIDEEVIDHYCNSHERKKKEHNEQVNKRVKELTGFLSKEKECLRP